MTKKKDLAMAPKKQLTAEERDLAKMNYLQALVNSGGLVSEAVASAGIEPTQLYKWRERDPDFVDLEEFARTAVDDALRQKINVLLAQGNEKIIVAAMKRLPEYQPKSVKQLEVSGSVTHEHVRKMDESERAILISEAAGLIEDADVETD